MRRAQVSTVDFITGVIIITLALVLSVNLILNIQEPSTFNAVQRQVLSASENLMSTGYPEDWNATNVIKAGILTDHKLNLTKLQRAASLPYGDLKQALNVQDDVYWYFANATAIIDLGACGYGSPAITTGADCEPSFNPDKNLVRIDRFVTHNNSIIFLVVIAWD